MDIPVDDGPALGQGVPVAEVTQPPTSRQVMHREGASFLHVEGVYELDPFPQAEPPWAYRWVEEHDCWKTADPGAFVM